MQIITHSQVIMTDVITYLRVSVLYIYSMISESMYLLPVSLIFEF